MTFLSATLAMVVSTEIPGSVIALGANQVKQPPLDGDIPTKYRFAETRDHSIRYHAFPVLVPPPIMEDDRFHAVASFRTNQQMSFHTLATVFQGQRQVTDSLWYEIKNVNPPPLNHRKYPENINYVPALGHVGEDSIHASLGGSNKVFTHFCNTQKAQFEMSHGGIVASHLTSFGSDYRDISTAIFRFGVAVYIGEDGLPTFEEEIRGHKFTAKKVFDTERTAYRVTPLLKELKIKHDADYRQGFLTWKIDDIRFSLPFGSRQFWIGEKLYVGGQYTVISEGNFYVGREVIDAILVMSKETSKDSPTIN